MNNSISIFISVLSSVQLVIIGMWRATGGCNMSHVTEDRLRGVILFNL